MSNKNIEFYTDCLNIRIALTKDIKGAKKCVDAYCVRWTLLYGPYIP